MWYQADGTTSSPMKVWVLRGCLVSVTKSDNHSLGAGTLFISLSLSSQYLVQCLLHNKSSRDICWLDELIHLLSLFWLSYHVPDTVGIYFLSHVWLFCDPMVCSWPGSSVHGISQARKLEWIAISCSRRSSPPRDQTHVSCFSCIGRQSLYHWAT